MPKKHKNIPGQMPLWEPESDWQHPTHFPEFKGVELLGFDVETRDPNLKSKGPGFIRQDAEVVGFSLSDGQDSFYFPFNHGHGRNLSRSDCINYLASIFNDPNRKIVGANTMYEREALWSLGITPKATIYDVQIAEPLIDEDQAASLESLGIRRLGMPKNEEKLEEAARDFGLDPKSQLWMLNPVYVGRYAEWDAWAPVHIWKQQMEEIRRQGLQQILELELAIQPILWKMRLRGIPVDTAAAKQLASEFYAKKQSALSKLIQDYGSGLPKLDVWSGPSLAVYSEANNLSVARTPKGNPSFTKEFLEASSHPFFKGVREVREYDRLASTFIDSWIIDNAVDGWVHPQWKQLASDDGGTRTGRMAASNPNPQQVPKRSKVGKRIRSLFRRPEGKWAKLDYSQQEPRILIHFAYRLELPGAAEARQIFIDNPDQDFYTLMMELANVERPMAKDLYLGRCYGMGIDKLAAKLRCDPSKAASILQQFDLKVPFIKGMAEICEHKAQTRGFIKTLGGRKRHFNQWVPANIRTAKERDMHDLSPVYSMEEAVAKWPGLAVRRADTRKALNSLIQGSAADMTKAAMLKVYREMDLYPYMQVHDELNYPVDSMEQALAIKQCMETCVDMSVPIKVDLDFEDTWS